MHADNSITAANAKAVMRAIIEGDHRMPAEIAADSGFLGVVTISDELKATVAKAIAENPEVVEKVNSTGVDRPVNALVV